MFLSCLFLTFQFAALLTIYLRISLGSVDEKRSGPLYLLNYFVTSQRRYLGSASSCLFVSIPPDRDRPLSRHLLALLDWHFLVNLHLLKVLHRRYSCLSNLCSVPPAVVHVVACDLIVIFWFMALVVAVVDLFQVLFLNVLVDHLTHGQLPVIDAHLRLHAVINSRLDVSSRCFRFCCATWELAFCRYLLRDVSRHESRRDRCRVRCEPPFFDVGKVLHVVVLMYLRSFPCLSLSLSRVLVACNNER